MYLQSTVYAASVVPNKYLIARLFLGLNNSLIYGLLCHTECHADALCHALLCNERVHSAITFCKLDHVVVSKLHADVYAKLF